MFKRVVKGMMVVAMFAGPVANAAGKAEMKFAVDATDIQSVIEVKVSEAQPAMRGLLSVDVRGHLDGEFVEQTMYIYESNNPQLHMKFKARKVEAEEVR